MTATPDCRVLIVEDDLQLRATYQDVFEYEGCEAEVVDNGRAALARLREVVPDLVVLDLHLPGIPGTQILDYIESDPRLATTRVIVMTADVPAAKALVGRSCSVLVKPIALEEFVKVIALLGTD